MSGAGRERHATTTHFVSVDDNVNAYKVEGHRHSAEIEQELPGVPPITFIAAPAAARPGPARELLRDADASR